MAYRYSLSITKRAWKDLLKLDDRISSQLLKKAFLWAASEEPMRQVIRLVGTGNRFRVRLGDYRLIFEKRANDKLVILLVLRIGHRKDIYRD